jgi:hypothetical protein
MIVLFCTLRNNVIPKTFCSYHGCGLVCEYVCVCEEGGAKGSGGLNQKLNLKM